MLAACAGGTDPDRPRPGPPAFIQLVGGPLSATVGTAVDVTVKVTDEQGTAVPGYLVNFVVVSGGGSVFVIAVNTSPAGEAKNRWTLGTRAGEQAIEVRAIDPATGTPTVFERVTATARPGPVVSLELHRETAIGWVAGEGRDAREVIRRAADEYGNTIPDLPVMVTATGGWSVSGTTVTPTAAWQEAQITVTSGSFSRTVKARSVPNWRSTQFTASFACYAVDTDPSSAQLVAELVVDSIDTGEKRADGRTATSAHPSSESCSPAAPSDGPKGL